jgi:hypothetical protein
MINRGVQPIEEVLLELESVTTGLYEKSGNFGLSREQFAAILNQIATKYLPPEASAEEVADLFTSLRVEEWLWLEPVPGMNVPGKSSWLVTAR